MSNLIIFEDNEQNREHYKLCAEKSSTMLSQDMKEHLK
jgi:hypothetical protein